MEKDAFTNPLSVAKKVIKSHHKELLNLAKDNSTMTGMLLSPLKHMGAIGADTLSKGLQKATYLTEAADTGLGAIAQHIIRPGSKKAFGAGIRKGVASLFTTEYQRPVSKLPFLNRFSKTVSRPSISAPVGSALKVVTPIVMYNQGSQLINRMKDRSKLNNEGGQAMTEQEVLRKAASLCRQAAEALEQDKTAALKEAAKALPQNGGAIGEVYGNDASTTGGMDPLDQLVGMHL